VSVVPTTQTVDDVSVRRHLAAVDDRVHQAVVHGDHDSLAWKDVDAAARELRDLPRPGPRGVDDNVGVNP
jgi:hypothetical protein